MPITTFSALAGARKITKQDVGFVATTPASVVANAWMSLFQSARPIIGAYTSGGGAVMNRLSAGGVVGLSDPISSAQSYLTGWGYTYGQESPGAVLLVDLLVAFGNINANTTSSQTIGTP